MLISDPALVLFVFDHLPLTTTWHVQFMAQNPRQYKPLTLIIVRGEFVNQRIDPLPLHDLLELDRHPGHRLLTICFLGPGKLTLKDVT